MDLIILVRLFTGGISDLHINVKIFSSAQPTGPVMTLAAVYSAVQI